MDTQRKEMKLEKPLIQAGMAGRITTPALVAAVSNTGALGTIGAGYLCAEDLQKQIQQIKKMTDRPFAVNVFATDLTAVSSSVNPMQTRLNKMRDELGLEKKQAVVHVQDDLHEKIDVLLRENIPMISTAFGVLSPKYIAKLKENGTVLIGMATNLAEAKQLVAAGYDSVVAQGYEAGGHRGTFEIDTYPKGCNIGLLTLLQECLQHLSVPVIAAGGITTKEQVCALLGMGAFAVQVGTAFLVAKEAGTNASYRKALLKATAEDTVITKVFSGRPARAIRNRFVEEIESSGVAIQPFPIQNEMTKDIRAAGKKQNMAAIQSLWAGQGVGMLHKEEAAADIIHRLLG